MERILVALGAVFAALPVSSPASAAPLAFTSAVRLQAPPNATSLSVNVYDPISAGSGVGGNAASVGPIRWSLDGSATVLPDPPTAYSSGASGINAAGQLVGTASLPGYNYERAVRWSKDGSPTVLALAPGQPPIGTADVYANSVAKAINDAGFAVGSAAQLTSASRAVMWAPSGAATLLGKIPGQQSGDFCQANNINETGQAVGFVTFGTNRLPRAVRWSADGSATALGEVPGLMTIRSEPYDINDAGQAVGSANGPLEVNSGRPLPVRWEADGSAKLLGELPGQTTLAGRAYGITDGGISCGGIGTHIEGGLIFLSGVIWDADGNATLLKDLMADGKNWTFAGAAGIDADATSIRVVVLGTPNAGPYDYYLLTAPIPEPTAASVLAAAALALLGERKRRPH